MSPLPRSIEHEIRRSDAEPAAALRAALERDVRAALDKLKGKRKIDVHAARKAIKHARAIVRLLRQELSDASYQRINRSLRNAGRSLAASRDIEVLLSTIASLERKHGLTSLQPLRDALAREQHASRGTSATGRDRITAKQHLKSAAEAIAKIDPTRADWPAIIAAFGQTYRRARKAARRARGAATSDNLHDWRKQVKYLWHQAQILIPLAPRSLPRMARDLHRLADRLGNHHDLAMLAARIEKGKEISADDRKDLQALLARRRVRLERKACTMGKRILAGKPKRLERKLEAAVAAGGD